MPALEPRVACNLAERAGAVKGREALGAAARARGVVLDLLVDIDLGQRRTGVRANEVVEFAGAIETISGTRFAGVQGYAGHLQHISDARARILANGKALGSLGHGEMWFHIDKCYHRQPHRATFLYGIEIPSEGGHTQFSSMYAAYENLPADLKRQLDGAMVVQGQQYGVGRRIDVTLPLESTHHCAQPIFVTNPGSGRKALYVASQNSMWIEGMDRDESEALLQRLFAIAEDPAIIYEHVWRPGDLVMWDNLACLHARTDWPSEQRRTLRRCTVEGEPLY